MTVKIYQKRLGINIIYLLKGEGCLMVDVGPSLALPRIKSWFKAIPVEPEEVSLVVITHAHFDHAGAIAGVKELTGAQVAVGQADGEMLRAGKTPLPTPVTPWGRVGYALLKPLGKALHYPGLEPDLLVSGQGLNLDEFGIPGRIIHTPGHTEGSLSVLLESGDAFVGCQTHNGPPFRLKPDHPVFAEDLAQLWHSWQILSELGAKTIYPGHGKAFPIEEILKMVPEEFT